MEPWQSWTIVGLAGAGVYWYYARSKSINPTRGRTSSSTTQIQHRISGSHEDNNKRRKKGKDTPGSDRNNLDAADASTQSAPKPGLEKVKKRKGTRSENNPPSRKSTIEDEKPLAEGVTSQEPDNDGMDNREFARQLTNLKAGTSLTKSVDPIDSKKNKKLGKRNGSLVAPSNGKIEGHGGASSHEISTTSSTTGADADDDLSPAASPALNATQDTKRSGDISDMLEAPAKKPSVLRLTQPTQPQFEREPKQKKDAPEPETKKQRQRRRKNEEAKAAREEAEKERRILMEKQRRTAREAEGRPAKNGLGVSNPPKISPWEKPAEGQAALKEPKATTTNGSGTLLDTFEEPTRSIGAVTKTEVNRTTATQKAWDREMPSEEEQMRLLSEMDDDGWNTVDKGGKAKKKNTSAAKELSDMESGKGDWLASGDVSSSNSNGNDNSTERTQNPKSNSSVGNRGNGVKESQPSSRFGVLASKSKTTKDQVDPKVWNRSNIHNHPDYDPEFPYALTGHPDDSDWAVV